MKKFKLINNNSQKNKLTHHSIIYLNNTKSDFIDIYSGENYMFLYEFSKDLKYDVENQIEIPLTALYWIKDSIINGFWRKPSDGGLPKNIHACRKKFDDEDIIITRSMNAGIPGEKGFSIKNMTRNSYILESYHQQIQLTDEMIINYLIPIIDKLLSE